VVDKILRAHNYFIPWVIFVIWGFFTLDIDRSRAIKLHSVTMMASFIYGVPTLILIFKNRLRGVYSGVPIMIMLLLILEIWMFFQLRNYPGTFEELTRLTRVVSISPMLMCGVLLGLTLRHLGKRGIRAPGATTGAGG
jgi:hypothetical protein